LRQVATGVDEGLHALELGGAVHAVAEVEMRPAVPRMDSRSRVVSWRTISGVVLRRTGSRLP